MELIILLSSALALESLANNVEADSNELDIVIFNIKRSRLFLSCMVEKFTDSDGKPSFENKEDDISEIDLMIKLAEFIKDMENHINSTTMNPKYEKLAYAALVAAEEALLWLGEHIEFAETTEGKKEESEELFDDVKEEDDFNPDTLNTHSQENDLLSSQKNDPIIDPVSDTSSESNSNEAKVDDTEPVNSEIKTYDTLKEPVVDQEASTAKKPTKGKKVEE